MNKTQLINKIRCLTDRQSLLNLLNEIKADMIGCESYPLTMRKMMELCNPRLDKRYKRYRMFTIPKKSGGEREIFAPRGNLKWMQLCLNEIFKVIYKPSIHAMGFAEGKSVVDNARMHTNQNYVFNIDLSDFFPSIDQARVWKRLQLAPFNFNKELANIIAGLCSIMSSNRRYNLPQGAPTSPILTNAICDTLDRRLAGLAKRFGLHYSRYADDITFSSMHNVYGEDSEFRKELDRIISDQRFSINPKKTRLHHKSERQEVTGLTVSEKVNVTRKYVKNIRAILHIWERYGRNAAVSAFFPRYKTEKGYLHPIIPDMENVIAGKLCYLKMVKGAKDPVYIKLAEQFKRLTNCNNNSVIPERSLEYLVTETIHEFEKRLKVEIQYAKSKYGYYYGFFEQNGERVIVAISRNIPIERMPTDVRISLCVRTEMKLGYDAKLVDWVFDKPDQTNSLGRMRLDCPLPKDLVRHYFYLLHRPLKDDTPRRYPIIDKRAEKFKKSIINFIEQYPEFELKDEMGLIGPVEKKDTLSRLVESGFDLSILS